MQTTLPTIPLELLCWGRQSFSLLHFLHSPAFALAGCVFSLGLWELLPPPRASPCSPAAPFRCLCWLPLIFQATLPTAREISQVTERKGHTLQKERELILHYRGSRGRLHICQEPEKWQVLLYLLTSAAPNRKVAF